MIAMITNQRTILKYGFEALDVNSFHIVPFKINEIIIRIAPANISPTSINNWNGPPPKLLKG